MAVTHANVEVVFDDPLSEDPPFCGHGPAILFEKYQNNNPNNVKRFFACSASRDRKYCSFFQRVDHTPSKTTVDSWAEKYQETVKSCGTKEDKIKRLQEVEEAAAEDRSYCDTCNTLVLSGEASDRGQHEEHSVTSPLSQQQLRTPSSFFKPKDESNNYAQYFFTPKTLDFLVSSVKALKADNVLNIGCPTLHERALQSDDVSSLLLELDSRFSHFFPDSFIHYNMFNHHFFSGKDGRKQFASFILRPSVVIVVDPPFGGLVDLLARSLHQIQSIRRNSGLGDACVFWIFPYFLENTLTSKLPSYTMLDYKVDYTNHRKFKDKGQDGAKGSPIRIYTNVSASRVPLPLDDGYKFCEACDRYVYEENWHCEICQNCTSKDGRGYKHCNPCGRCVKPSLKHCEACNRCKQEEHSCAQGPHKGCHLCGAFGHKRRDCPQKGQAMDVGGTPRMNRQLRDDYFDSRPHHFRGNRGGRKRKPRWEKEVKDGPSKKKGKKEEEKEGAPAKKSGPPKEGAPAKKSGPPKEGAPAKKSAPATEGASAEAGETS